MGSDDPGGLELGSVDGAAAVLEQGRVGTKLDVVEQQQVCHFAGTGDAAFVGVDADERDLRRERGECTGPQTVAAADVLGDTAGDTAAELLRPPIDRCGVHVAVAQTVLSE